MYSTDVNHLVCMHPATISTYVHARVQYMHEVRSIVIMHKCIIKEYLRKGNIVYHSMGSRRYMLIKRTAHYTWRYSTSHLELLMHICKHPTYTRIVRIFSLLIIRSSYVVQQHECC